MSEIRTGILITLKGNVEERAKRYGQAITRFSQTGQRDLTRFQRAAENAGRGLETLGKSWAGVLTVAGALATVRKVGTFGDRLTDLGIAADATDAQMQNLRKGVIDTANTFKVAPDEVVDAIADIAEKTGDLKFAEDNIKNIGLAMQATGASGKDIGGLLAEFQKMDIKAPEDVLKALDMLNVQGKEGAFTLQELAALGPRVITAYTATGRGGVEALREMGAALQAIRQGTGSSQMAATAFESTISTLTDPQKIKQLKEVAGIDVYEHMANGEKVLKPINKLMMELVNASGGDREKLGTIFGEQAIRAFNAAAAEFKRTGATESLERFFDVHSDGTQTLRDAERRAKTYGAAMQTLSNAWTTFADANLAAPVEALAGAINSVSPEQFKRWSDAAKTVAVMGAGIYAISKLSQLGNRRNPQTGVGGGSLTGAGGAPVPVYIVGGGSGIMNTFGGGGAYNNTPPAPASPGKQPGRFGKALGVAGAGLNIAGAVAQAGMLGWAVGSVLNEGINEFVEKKTGNKAGLGGLIADWVHGDDLDFLKKGGEKQEVGGELKIKIEADVPAKVEQLKKKGDMDLSVNTGSLRGGH